MESRSLEETQSPDAHSNGRSCKRSANIMSQKDKYWFLDILGKSEGFEKPHSNLLSELRKWVEFQNNASEIRLRMEKEIENTEFHLKRGSDLGRFDQFLDDDSLFECRNSQSKWLHLKKYFSHVAPPEIYSQALEGNKNIIHIAFSIYSDSDVPLQTTICDLPWVTSKSFGLQPTLPAIHLDLLFIKSTNNDLITFAKEMSSWTLYIFSRTLEALTYNYSRIELALLGIMQEF